jgi:hypothetical protein
MVPSAPSCSWDGGAAAGTSTSDSLVSKHTTCLEGTVVLGHAQTPIRQWLPRGKVDLMLAQDITFKERRSRTKSWARDAL